MKRRNFLKAMGISSLGTAALAGRKFSTHKQGVLTRSSAENVIFITLAGAPSHVDTFDIKKGSWTPADFEPASVGNIELAGGLFPQLLGQADKFSLLRAISGTEAVHDRARYVQETAHTFNPAFAREQPHLGSIIALEMAAGRKSTDIFPAFIAINGNVHGAGMLPATYAPLMFNSGGGLSGLTHPAGEAVFAKRYEALGRIDPKAGANGAGISDYGNFYTSGKALMYEPDVEEALAINEADLARYGSNETGLACAMAVKILAKDRGARMIQITHGSWDHHFDIYDKSVADNIYDLSGTLDPALANMLSDLAATPGKRGGSLLDETLVIAAGEFGRTPGTVTNNLGRDHYQYAWSALVAGGGIVPNQTFGGTDADGFLITDPFWSEPRYITMVDVTATIYSALGIDWTTEIADTPSGRVFEYTPKYNGGAGYYKDIAQMFQS